MPNPKPGHLEWRQIHWPRPLEPDQVEWLFRRLATDETLLPLALETRGSAGRIKYIAGISPSKVAALNSFLASMIPGTVTTKLRSEVPSSGVMNGGGA